MASLSDVVFHERQIWALQVFIFRRLIWVAHSVDGFIAVAGFYKGEPYFFLVNKPVFNILTEHEITKMLFLGAYDVKVWIWLSQMGPNRRSFQDGEKVQILGSVFQWRVHVSPHG